MNLDETKLMMLGPLSRVVFVLTQTSNAQRLNSYIPIGIKYHEPGYDPLKQSVETNRSDIEPQTHDNNRSSEVQHVPTMSPPLHDLGYFNQSFFLFRGVEMKENYIQDWVS